MVGALHLKIAMLDRTGSRVTPDELEQQLRTLLAEAGLSWVLQQVDDAVAEGNSEEVRLKAQRARPRGRYGDEEAIFIHDEVVYERVSIPSHREPDGARIHITTRPYTTAERVQLLIAALRRLLIDLPRVQQEQVKLLSLHQGDAPRVEGIQFLRDEGTSRASTEITILPQSSDSMVSEDTLLVLLTAIEAKVRE
ncbi:hypothetical protein [Nonomuraea sp. NPDC049607]|uniref:hypothetical protein n=1 Tax=Nonomuraea sp. NPDC049607 TaxID=3154732 RepID=UPI00344929BE